MNVHDRELSMSCRVFSSIGGCYPLTLVSASQAQECVCVLIHVQLFVNPCSLLYLQRQLWCVANGWLSDFGEQLCQLLCWG